MTSPSTNAKIWIVTEGHAGMVNQGLGIAGALGLPHEIKTVGFRLPWRLLAPRIGGNILSKLTPGSSSIAPPWPRILIGVGRQSIPVSVAVRRLSGGTTFTVQTQAPRFALSAFDLVVPPLHDDIVGPNVFSIIGAPHRIDSAALDHGREAFRSLFGSTKLPRIAVLIGGNSRSHRLPPDRASEIARDLRALAADGASLMVTLSRRTPEIAAKIIRDGLVGTNAWIWDGTGTNPYFGLLAFADAILVTDDSVNMMTEAAATGAPVHIIHLPGGKPKLDHFKAELFRRGIAREWAGTLAFWNYEPLRETARVAAHIRALAKL